MTARVETPGWGFILGQRSVLFLIAVNLIPLVGVVAFGWNAGFLMLIYWMETVAIGLFNIPKLLTARKGWADRPWWLVWLSNLFITGFFCLHYGMFNFGHVTFLNSLFALPEVSMDVWLAAAGLSLSHAFSLFVNWFGKGEYRQVTSAEQMFKPYGRIVIMHAAILLGAFFMIGGNQTALAPLVILIVLKTASDIVAHAISHRWIRLDVTA